MSEQTIKASLKIKILGVILDQALRYKKHVFKAVDKGVKTAFVFKRLINLRSETARKLVKSKVALAIDYASIILAPSATVLALKRLDKAQRIGAQVITRAFSTVFLLIIEVEAALTSTIDRLYWQQLSTWIKWYTKLPLHSFWKVKWTIDLANKTWISLLQKMTETFKDIDLGFLEKLNAYVKAPWNPPANICISEKEIAIAKAIHCRDPIVAFIHGWIRRPPIYTCEKELGYIHDL